MLRWRVLGEQNFGPTTKGNLLGPLPHLPPLSLQPSHTLLPPLKDTKSRSRIVGEADMRHESVEDKGDQEDMAGRKIERNNDALVSKPSAGDANLP